MKLLTIAILASLVSINTSAQTATSPMPAGVASQAAMQKDMTDGEIRKFDKGAKKITLKHGPIKNLDMPGMTMVFQVRDAALLEQLSQMAAGDKIKFTAEEQQGAMVVTGAEKVVSK
jgi:Cu(I)/Ag(I) efflux system periplasmic protein CusF